MRTTRTTYRENVSGRFEAVLEEKDVPRFLYDLLASVTLTSVQLRYQNGDVVEYTAWEYSCEWCGSYEHKGEACPELEDEEEATDPLPSGCEWCGVQGHSIETCPTFAPGLIDD